MSIVDVTEAVLKRLQAVDGGLASGHGWGKRLEQVSQMLRRDAGAVDGVHARVPLDPAQPLLEEAGGRTDASGRHGRGRPPPGPFVQVDRRPKPAQPADEAGMDPGKKPLIKIEHGLPRAVPVRREPLEQPGDAEALRFAGFVSLLAQPGEVDVEVAAPVGAVSQAAQSPQCFRG